MKGPPQARDYRAANWDSTSLHAGESWAALVARHCTIRPPPGCTPPQIERTSAPHADRSTSNSSRGRIGRSTITAGAAGAAAAAAPAGAAPAAGAAAAVEAAGAAAFGAAVSAGLAVPAGLEVAAAGASTARTALWQLDERLDMFFCRHCSAASPPGGTLEQCAI